MRKTMVRATALAVAVAALTAACGAGGDDLSTADAVKTKLADAGLCASTIPLQGGGVIPDTSSDSTKVVKAFSCRDSKGGSVAGIAEFDSPADRDRAAKDNPAMNRYAGTGDSAWMVEVSSRWDDVKKAIGPAWRPTR